MKKPVSLVLLATILLQSCVAYQKTSVSLNEATNKGKVKLIDANGRVYAALNIEMQDSIYYALIKKNKIALVESQYSGIYLEDKKKSKTQTVIFWASFVIVVGFGFALLLGQAFENLANSI